MFFLNFLSVYPSVACVAVLIPWLALRWFIVPDDRKRTEWALAVTTIIEPACGAAEAIATSLSRLRPLKYDLFIYRIDALFGSPSFLLGRQVAQHPSLRVLVNVTYGSLPIAMVGVFLVTLWFGSEAAALKVLRTFALNLVAAVPIYLLIPVCGPEFAFADFPFTRPSPLLARPIAIDAAPNGIPSVHTSSALLVLWFLGRWRWGRVFGGVFLLLTMFATLGSGQHYFFDLLCALPYAAAVCWMETSISSRSIKKSYPSRSGSDVTGSEAAEVA